MTRKDYVMLSTVLRAAKPLPMLKGAMLWWLVTSRAIADAIAKDNPRFDRARFLKDAGVPE